MSEIDFDVYHSVGRKIDLKRLILPDLGGDSENEGANQGNILLRDKYSDQQGDHLINWENMFLVEVESMTDPGTYGPFLAIDQGIWVEKDIQSYGVFMSSTDPNKPSGGGAIMLGHGFQGTLDPPAIYLSDSTIQNLVSYSEDLSNAVWTGYSGNKNNITLANGSNDPVGPDGSNKNSLKIDTSVSGGCTGCYQSVNPSLQANQDYIVSIWLKGDVGGETVRIGLNDSFESTNISLTNSWVRYSFTAAPTSGSTSRGIQFRCLTANATYYAWGAQLETGTILKSYATTTTSSNAPFDTLHLEGAGLPAHLDLGNLIAHGGVTIGGGTIYWQTATNPDVLEMNCGVIIDGALNVSGISINGSLGITSTNLVSNLNADLLDGHHWSDIPSIQWSAGAITALGTGLSISTTTLGLNSNLWSLDTGGNLIIQGGLFFVDNTYIIYKHTDGAMHIQTPSGKGVSIEQSLNVGAGCAITGPFGVVGGANFQYLQNNTYGYAPSFTYGLAIGWNYSGDGGEVSLFSNNAGGNAGGFNFYDKNGTGAITKLARLSGEGVLTTLGAIYGATLGSTSDIIIGYGGYNVHLSALDSDVLAVKDSVGEMAVIEAGYAKVGGLLPLVSDLFMFGNIRMNSALGIFPNANNSGNIGGNGAGTNYYWGAVYANYLEYHTSHGAFDAIDDLALVKGYTIKKENGRDIIDDDSLPFLKNEEGFFTIDRVNGFLLGCAKATALKHDEYDTILLELKNEVDDLRSQLAEVAKSA